MEHSAGHSHGKLTTTSMLTLTLHSWHSVGRLPSPSSRAQGTQVAEGGARMQTVATHPAPSPTPTQGLVRTLMVAAGSRTAEFS